MCDLCMGGETVDNAITPMPDGAESVDAAVIDGEIGYVEGITQKLRVTPRRNLFYF